MWRGRPSLLLPCSSRRKFLAVRTFFFHSYVEAYFSRSSCFSIFSFLCNVMLTMFCLFLFSLLDSEAVKRRTVETRVLLCFTASDYIFSIFKLLLMKVAKRKCSCHKKCWQQVSFTWPFDSYLGDKVYWVCCSHLCAHASRSVNAYKGTW